MNFAVLTIFPEMFDPFWDHGIIRRAIEHKIILTSTVNIRDYARDRHQVTDDRPYGGGSGMVMKPEPLAGAIRTATREMPAAGTVLLTPQGRPFDQNMAKELASLDGLVLICGRYEGVDERICHDLIDHEISIGDIRTVLPFHAGTKMKDGKLYTNGGRVIALTGLGKNLGEALSKSYVGGEAISWEGKRFRADIGFDLKALGQ